MPLNSGIKKFMPKRGISRFSIENLLSQCRKISRRNASVLCFRNFPVAKKFKNKRGGGVSRACVENFLSHSAEKLVGETF